MQRSFLAWAGKSGYIFVCSSQTADQLPFRYMFNVDFHNAWKIGSPFNLKVRSSSTSTSLNNRVGFEEVTGSDYLWEVVEAKIKEP